MATESLVREFTRLHQNRLPFAVGQVWKPRNTFVRFIGPDLYRIEAISDHPKSPIIARHVASDTLGAYGWNGHESGDAEKGDSDLIEMVSP